MVDLENTWLEMYGKGGQKAAPPASGAPAETPVAPMSDTERTWHEMYGKSVPAQSATTAPPPPTSTPMEARAIEASKQGKKHWNVNEAYRGSEDPARAQYNSLIQLGASPKEALFLTGAAASESNFDPTAVHDQGTGYGLYGHRLDRLTAMRKFAGTEYPSQIQQNAFALQELRSRPEWDMINNAKNARELAIAQMHYERPQGYTPSDPTGGLNFAGRLGTLNKFSSFMGEGEKIAPGELAPEWGAMQSAASGAAFGFGPQIRAAYKAGGLSGPQYEAYLHDLQRQEQLYKEQNPLSGYGAEAVGTMVSPGMLLRGAKVVAPFAAPYLAPITSRITGYLAPKVAPVITAAEPYLQTAGELLGPTGVAGVEGAGQAALQTGLEAGSQALGGTLGDTETPFAEQFKRNVLTGGVLGAGLSKALTPKAGGVFAPEWEGNARALGQAAFDKYKIPVSPGQFAKGEAKQFFEKTASQGNLDAQAKRYSEELAKSIGAKDLTPAGWDAAKKAAGKEYDTFAASVGTLAPTPTAGRKFYDIYTSAYGIRDPNIRNTVMDILTKIGDDLRTGRMNGTMYRNYVKSGEIIDNKLLGLDNATKKHFGGKIRDALDTLVRDNFPAEADQLIALNSRYRDIKTLEKLTTTSGIVNPKAVAKKVKSKGASANSPLQELGPIGEFLPKVNEAGEAVMKKPAETGVMAALGRYGMYGGGYAYLASELPIVNSFLQAGGPLFAQAVPYAAGGVAAAGATIAGKRALTELASQPEWMKRAIFEQKVGKTMKTGARKAVRPLLHAGISYNPLTGVQE
jgi:hypothetical protein